MKNALILAMLALVSFVPARLYSTSEDTSSCIACHGSATKMKAAGFAQFTVTASEAMKQTRMEASCTECHGGNPKDATKDGAHEGLHRVLIVTSQGMEARTRDKLETFRPEALQPDGGNGMVAMLPKVQKNGRTVKDPTVQTILYHDSNPVDLSSDYDVQVKTCGACHPDEVSQFRKTAMGQNGKQSIYKNWTDEKGPHNCGPWFANGYDEIARNTKVPYTREMMSANQKACNVCHVGCLDCHYSPGKKDPSDPETGMHTFTAKVTAETCYGGGRGSICHAGPEDRRRGGGYIGGEFANPSGIAPDVHHTKAISCTDCHNTPSKDNRLLHGQVKRQVDCSKCHEAAVKSVEQSVHRNLSCEACHIRDVGGYTATCWGPGKVAGVATPFFKYKEYYGIMKEPVLIKNRKGVWIPVKPYPAAVLNQKGSGNLKRGLAWRFPENSPDIDRTEDTYAFVGLLSGLPKNDNALAWIQMDKVSHEYGKARNCESCHTPGGEQRQEVSWSFSDEGADPFTGRHTVLGNSKGLYIKDIRATSEIKPHDGAKIEDFGPWFYLGDKWWVEGNFSIPEIRDRKLFEETLLSYESAVRAGGKYHSLSNTMFIK